MVRIVPLRWLPAGGIRTTRARLRATIRALAAMAMVASLGCSGGGTAATTSSPSPPGIQLISASSSGAVGDQDCQTALAQSADGNIVAFSSSATNLASGTATGDLNAFVRNHAAHITTVVSTTSTIP